MSLININGKLFKEMGHNARANSWKLGQYLIGMLVRSKPIDKQLKRWFQKTYFLNFTEKIVFLISYRTYLPFEKILVIIMNNNFCCFMFFPLDIKQHNNNINTAQRDDDGSVFHYRRTLQCINWGNVTTILVPTLTSKTMIGECVMWLPGICVL